MGVRTPSVEQRLLFYGDKGKFLLDKVKGGGFLEQVEGGKFILDTKPNFFMVSHLCILNSCYHISYRIT